MGNQQSDTLGEDTKSQGVPAPVPAPVSGPPPSLSTNRSAFAGTGSTAFMATAARVKSVPEQESLPGRSCMKGSRAASRKEVATTAPEAVVAKPKAPTEGTPGDDSELGSILVASVPGKPKKKGKHAVSAAAAAHPSASLSSAAISWGVVSCREFRRLVGGSGGIPEHSAPEWTLGLSDAIVSRDAAEGRLTDVTREWPGLDGVADESDSDGDAPLEALRGHVHHPGGRKGGSSKRGVGAHASPRLGGSGSPKSTPRFGSTAHGSPKAPGASAAGPAVSAAGEALSDGLPDLLALPELALGAAAAVAASPAVAGTPVRRRTSAVGVQALGSVDEFEARRERWLRERTEGLPARERGVANGETRQWSHRSSRQTGGNPLFRYLDVKERAAAYAEDVGDIYADGPLRRNQRVVRRLTAITESRKKAGCSCKGPADTATLKKATRRRLLAEAEGRGMHAHGLEAHAIIDMIVAHDALHHAGAACLPTAVAALHAPAAAEAPGAAGAVAGGSSASGRAPLPAAGHAHDTAAPPHTSLRDVFPLMDAALAVARAERLHQWVEDDLSATAASVAAAEVAGGGDVTSALTPSLAVDGAVAAGTPSAAASAAGVPLSLACPCALAGVSCTTVNDLCTCAASCHNMVDVLDITAYGFNAEGVQRYRHAVLARLREVATGPSAAGGAGASAQGRCHLTDEDAGSIQAAVAAAAEAARVKAAAKAAKEAKKARRKEASAAAAGASGGAAPAGDEGHSHDEQEDGYGSGEGAGAGLALGLASLLLATPSAAVPSEDIPFAGAASGSGVYQDYDADEALARQLAEEEAAAAVAVGVIAAAAVGPAASLGARPMGGAEEDADDGFQAVKVSKRPAAAVAAGASMQGVRDRGADSKPAASSRPAADSTHRGAPGSVAAASASMRGKSGKQRRERHAEASRDEAGAAAEESPAAPAVDVAVPVVGAAVAAEASLDSPPAPAAAPTFQQQLEALAAAAAATAAGASPAPALSSEPSPGSFTSSARGKTPFRSPRGGRGHAAAASAFPRAAPGASHGDDATGASIPRVAAGSVDELASGGGAAVLDSPPDRARFTSPRGGQRGRGTARPFSGQRETGPFSHGDAADRLSPRAEDGAEGAAAPGARPGGHRGGGGGGRGSGAFRRGDRTAAAPDGAADVRSPSAAATGFGGIETASASRSSHRGRGGRIGGGDAQPGLHTSRGRGGRGGGGGRSGGPGGSEPASASAAGPGPAYVLSPQSAAANASSAATPA